MPTSVLIAVFLVSLGLWIAVGFYYDLTYLRLPKPWLKIGAILLIVSLAVVSTLSSVHVGAVATGACVGAITWCAAYFIVAISAPGHLGGGDIKLALICGAWIGGVHLISYSAHNQPFGYEIPSTVSILVAVGVAIVVANCLTIAHFLLQALTVGRKKGEQHRVLVPHGPSMMVATALVCCTVSWNIWP